MAENSKNHQKSNNLGAKPFLKVIVPSLLIKSVKNFQIQIKYVCTDNFALGCVLFSVFEISKTTVGHKCSLVRKVEKWF